MISKFIKGNTAVFVDAANIELSAKDLNFRINYKKLHKWLLSQSEVKYLGFYTARFDTPEHDNFLTMLKKNGYKLVTKNLKIIRAKTNSHLRKANFDVEIAVDALKYLSQYETIILFSGDSDFAYLIGYLHECNKKVIVASLKHHISKELIERSDYYLDLTRIRKDIQRP